MAPRGSQDTQDLIVWDWKSTLKGNNAVKKGSPRSDGWEAFIHSKWTRQSTHNWMASKGYRQMAVEKRQQGLDSHHIKAYWKARGGHLYLFPNPCASKFLTPYLISYSLTPKVLWGPKRLFSFLGRLLWMHSIFVFFETFCGYRCRWYLSNETIHASFGYAV
jgi:hypothetical protein